MSPFQLVSRQFVVGDYRKLEVWRKAHALAINVNRDAGTIRGARYGSLRSQLIRAAMSIPANIVEGRSQASERDFARFLRYALSSASEFEYHLTLARDIQVLPNKTFTPLASQVIEVRTPRRKPRGGRLWAASSRPVSRR